MTLKPKPLVLIILDGWGCSASNPYNAISLAKTPQWNQWKQNFPYCELEASSQFVGLPSRQMGNSEVGHMHIGAGRIIPQDLTQINQAIKDGDFEKNEVLLNLIHSVKKDGKFLHVMGLFSDGGVHSHEHHLFSFLALCHQHHFKEIALHLFLDGRDTSPQNALNSLARLQRTLKEYPGARICSITGRYFAMDRDHRWERVQPFYELVTKGESNFHFKTPEEAIEYFYAEGQTDEFVPPTLIGEKKAIEAGDSVFFFNFRADRARQLTEAFLSSSFQGFTRPIQPQLKYFVTMTEYGKHLQTEVAFPPLELVNTLGEIISNNQLYQLRIAETEKYAHVTFFFNGGTEASFPNEKRLLIPSPKVQTYDLLPQMSAPKLTDALVDAIKSQTYDLIICNYANADMVGHTGNLKAAIEAIECLDQCFIRLGKALNDVNGALLMTADHGNVECMFDESSNQPHTAHTCEPVPFLFIGKNWELSATKKKYSAQGVTDTTKDSQSENQIDRNKKVKTVGSLIDIAPTILALLNIPQPKEMTGQALLKPKKMM